MKKTLLITLLISVKIILSQTYLVPYKIGNKMGLSDELAKLVIKPQYDAIEYLYTETNENYFKYTNVSLKTDTVISYGNKKVAQDKKVYTYGLYKKNKILITNQSCSDFIVYPNFIVASTNAYNALNCVVYNLKGKQLTTEPIYHLLVNEQRVIGKLKNMNSKYSLLSIYQRDDNKNSTFSLALFDNEKQDITQWLLKKVSAFTQNLSLNLEPVYGILLAFILFNENEELDTSFYIGFSLIAFSVVLQMLRVVKRRHV